MEEVPKRQGNRGKDCLDSFKNEKLPLLLFYPILFPESGDSYLPVCSKDHVFHPFHSLWNGRRIKWIEIVEIIIGKGRKATKAFLPYSSYSNSSRAKSFKEEATRAKEDFPSLEIGRLKDGAVVFIDRVGKMCQGSPSCGYATVRKDTVRKQHMDPHHKGRRDRGIRQEYP